MMRISRLIPIFLLLILGGCSSEEPDTLQGVEQLAVPQPSISVVGDQVTVRWAAVENARQYGWELACAGAVERGTCYASPYSFTLEAGASCRFRVRALAVKGSAYADSQWSSWVEAQSGARPKLAAPEPVLTPEGLTESSVRISWQAVEGASSYSYELYAEEAAEPMLTGVAEGCELSLDALSAACDYRFRLRALSSDDEWEDSAWSQELCFTTLRPSSGVDVGLPLSWENDGVVRAFPGAEGGGMYTTGGRGGEIYHVTNLNDSGAGSLRDAVSKPNRTIVFDVAGTIRLKSDLKIQKDNLTLAGQTAPGDGICVADATVQISADNIIIRYLRFRLGDQGPHLSDGSDALWGRYNENIILDHCSMSWSVDEVASFYANRNFTMQWCILSEAMANSVHSKGGHGYGGIWGGRNASFHHNLLANNGSRNPRIDHPDVYDNYLTTHRGNVDLRNNVIYNWGDNSTYGGEGGWFNFVGNYYKPGPSSKKRNYFVDAYALYDGTDRNYPRLYFEENYHAGDYAAAINSDPRSGIYWHNGSQVGDVAGAWQTALMAIKADDTRSCYTTTHPADLGYERVVASAGASLRRDAVDSRVAAEVQSGGGKLIDSQAEVGGWPELSATEEELARAATDTDADGIPDYYEELLGLNPADAADGAKITLDPAGLYSNLEVYLHYLVRERTRQQVEAGEYRMLE